MMQIKVILFSFFFSFYFSAQAQILNSSDIYDHKTLDNQTLKIFTENGLITLKALQPNLIKVNFFKKDFQEKESSLEKNNGVYVRVTQNLEDVFMQTDSLLIIINKLNFTIKFQTLRERIYTISQIISLSDSCNNFSLSTTKNEVFFNTNGRKLKQKNYKIKNLKAVYSSKRYSIYFAKSKKGVLKFAKENMQIQYCDGMAALSFYFLSGDKEEMKKNYKSVHNLEN